MKSPAAMKRTTIFEGPAPRDLSAKHDQYLYGSVKGGPSDLSEATEPGRRLSPSLHASNCGPAAARTASSTPAGAAPSLGARDLPCASRSTSHTRTDR